MPADGEESTAPMRTFPDSSGQRYFSINRFYRERFGEKVYKIAVAAAYDCPNRSGGSSGCIFCDQWGSAAVHQTMHLPLDEQISRNRDFLSKRYRVNRFLVYFQAFSNTYRHTADLEASMALALKQPDVVGIIIGTRPDCLPPETMALLRGFSRESFISVELGVQSFDDRQLAFLRRGHSSETSISAIQQLRKTTGVHIGVHLIFGLPHETSRDIISTAETINALPIDSVKLHNLHVLKHTPLERLYHTDAFKPLELKDYAERVVLFLEHLCPEIPVQRLAAYAGPDVGLIAPDWTADRTKPAARIQQMLAERNTWQGIRWPKPSNT